MTLGSRETGLAFRALRATVYGAAFFLFWVWLALRVRVLDAALGGPLPMALRWAGAPLMAVGAGVAFSCAALFVVRGRGTPAPFDPPVEFVATGPYRRVRNPMYLGGLLFLAGFGLWYRSPSMLLFVLALWGLIHLFVVYVEEPGLRRRFGGSYQAYLDEVPRWVPRRSDGRESRPRSPGTEPPFPEGEDRWRSPGP